jgi:hypothetical protein
MRHAEEWRIFFGKKKKGKTIPVTGNEGTYGCETSWLPHFVDNRLTDCDDYVPETPG